MTFCFVSFLPKTSCQRGCQPHWGHHSLPPPYWLWLHFLICSYKLLLLRFRQILTRKFGRLNNSLKTQKRSEKKNLLEKKDVCSYEASQVTVDYFSCSTSLENSLVYLYIFFRWTESSCMKHSSKICVIRFLSKQLESVQQEFYTKCINMCLLGMKFLEEIWECWQLPDATLLTVLVSCSITTHHSTFCIVPYKID